VKVTSFALFPSWIVRVTECGVVCATHRAEMGCLGVCIQRTPGAREHDHRWILNAWGGSSAIEKIGSQGRPVLCSFLVKKFGDDRGHAGQQIGTGEVWKSVGGCGNRVDHWTSDDALPFLRRIDCDRGLAVATAGWRWW